MSKYENYSIEIAGVKRDLPLFEIKPGLQIAILNILGDTELVQASAKDLAKKVKDLAYDIIVTAGSHGHWQRGPILVRCLCRCLRSFTHCK